MKILKVFLFLLVVLTLGFLGTLKLLGISLRDLRA